MMNNCGNCRFCNGNKCMKYNINITETYKACNDYASKVEMNEDVKPQKLQLND